MLNENPKPKFYPKRLENFSGYFAASISNLGSVIRRFTDEVQELGLMTKDLVLGMKSQTNQYEDYIENVRISMLS